MKSRRWDLHSKLQSIIDSEFVYFQPPESIKMKYPCIVYSLNKIDIKYADNKSYMYEKRYTVTIIDKNPDSVIPDKMLIFPMCKQENFFTSDNLNHWVFDLYY